MFTHNPSNRRNDYTPITFRPPIESSPFTFRFINKYFTTSREIRVSIADSLAVLFPIARNNMSPLNSSLPYSIRSACRFSQPHSGLLLILSGGFVSYHWHFGDLPYRAFPLVAALHSHRMQLPYTISIFRQSQQLACIQIDIVKLN